MIYVMQVLWNFAIYEWPLGFPVSANLPLGKSLLQVLQVTVREKTCCLNFALTVKTLLAFLTLTNGKHTTFLEVFIKE